MNALAARRRHPAAALVLLLLGLLLMGALYAVFAPQPARAAQPAASTDQVEAGRQLFLANCATCHGTAAAGGNAGPSLVGVGAAAVDFQVGTGRMPLAAPGVQAMRSDVKFSQPDIDRLAAYVASLGPGPAVPEKQDTEGKNANIAKGGELFRVNCAMCHNFAGSGGALTRGKYAPSLRDVEGKHIYEAMLTGPQSMPVFSDANLGPDAKNDIIAFLHEIDKNENPGGAIMGNLGPVTEGMFAWVAGLGLMIGAAVWLGSKAA